MTWLPSIALLREGELSPRRSRIVAGLVLFFLMDVSLVGCRRQDPIRSAPLPPSAMAAFLRAKTARLLREPRETLLWSIRVLSADPYSVMARIDAASALAVLGRLDRARDLLRKAPEQGVEVLFQRARLAALAGDRTQARVLTRCLDKKAQTADSWTEVSRLWRLLSDRQAEGRALSHALARRPDHLGALLRLVWWLRRQGRYRDAARILSRAGRVHPEAYNISVERLAILLDRGRSQSAWRMLHSLREDNPADLDLADRSFRLALFMGRRDLAEGVLASLSRYRGASYQAFVAQCYLDMGAFGRAGRLASQALGDHWSLSAFRVRLVSLLAAGARDEAIEMLAHFLERPRFDEALTGVAEPLAGWGLCRPALAVYRSKTNWAAKNPSCRAGAWVLLERARLEAICGDRTRALSAEKAVARRCGLASGIAFARSAVLAAAGRPRAAARLALRQALGDPDDPVAANQAGYLLADAGMDLDRAERFLRLALLAEPLSGAIRDSLGWLEYRRGRLRRAEQLLASARRLLPAEPEVAWHFGALYQTLARRCSGQGCGRRYVRLARLWYGRATTLGLAPRFRLRLERHRARLDSLERALVGSRKKETP